MNRSSLVDKLEREISRARRAQEPLALLAFTIKGVIDAEALGQASRLLETSLRPYDLVASDEPARYLVVLPETGLPGARSVADRIRHKLLTEVPGVDSFHFNLSELLPDDDPETLISRALEGLD